MRRNQWLIILLVAVFLLSCSLITPSSKILKIGYVKDAPPISSKYLVTDDFGNEYEDVLGYCGELKNYLENNLGGKYDKIELVEIPSYKDRFKRYKNISVELGASSITDTRAMQIKNKGGKFSIPFHDTYTKLLVNNNKIKDFQSNLPSNRIGIIQSTTTTVVEKIYTKAEFIEVSNRGEALENLKTGNIDAYASDEILLKSIQNELSTEKFSIFPQDGFFRFEAYGVVVYNDDQLLEKINEWIKYKDQIPEEQFLVLSPKNLN